MVKFFVVVFYVDFGYFFGGDVVLIGVFVGVDIISVDVVGVVKDNFVFDFFREVREDFGEGFGFGSGFSSSSFVIREFFFSIGNYVVGLSD